MIKLLLFFLTWCVVTAHAVDTRVSIKKVSQSGKTILLDTGSYTGLKERDRAKLVYQQSMDGGDYKEIATIELVKVYPNYSYWSIIDKNDESEELKTGMNLILFPYDDLLKGKRPYRFLKKKVLVDSFDDVKRYKKSMGTIEGDNPVYKKKDHDFYFNDLDGDSFDPDRAVETTLGKYKVSKRGEFKLLDYEDEFALKDSVDQNMETVISDEKSLNDDEAASGVIGATSKRVGNVYKRGYETLDQMYKREKFLQESEGTLANMDAKKKLSNSEYIEKNRLNKRLGPMWSASMNDESIRRYVLRSGFDEERERQKYAMTHKKGHELYMRYSFDTGDNISKTDSLALQGLAHSFSFGFGYHLSQTSAKLDNWVINMSFVAADDYYNMGVSNFKSTEKALRFMLDYYLNGTPDQMGSYTWFIGAGIKLGKTELTSGDFRGEAYRYDLRSFESIRLGFRYRFDGGDELDKIIKVGYGFTVMASYEATTVSAADLGALPNEMDTRTKVDDVRITMGFDFFF